MALALNNRKRVDMPLNKETKPKKQIDYVFINKKWKNSAMNCKAYSSFGGVSSCYILTYADSHLHTCTYICRIIHNDTKIKTDAGRLLLKYTSQFICKVRKGLLKVFVWEGAGDRTETAIFWTLLLWLSALCLSCSSDAQPEAQRPTLLADGFLYCILSASSLDLNSSGPQGPFGLMWLSLPHLVYNSVSNSNCNSTWLLSWLSYILVQHPLSRLLDLRNRMFDRLQAEITVMQFTGHSLPVHQSMSVPWEFFFYLVPFHQPISARAISSQSCH